MCYSRLFCDQIAYELGETYLHLLDCKLSKLRGRVGEGIVFDERTMKKAEITKCNEYCRGALIMFNHFIHFYSKSADKSKFTGNSPFKNLSLEELKDLPLNEPDESLYLL
jgi:hypothetical protein